jgi:3-oxoadipate enol-lactonase
MWGEQIAPLLHSGWRVVRIDMRGHGGSDPVPGDYTMDELADDCAAVIEALGLSGVHYMGLSIGGMFGHGLALRHGQRLKSLLLCDTSCATPPAPPGAWSQRYDTVRKANSVAPLADGTLERWFTPAMKEKNPGRFKQIRDTIVATTPDGFCGCVAAIQGFDYSARLPQIKLPTLVVWGADDPGTPPEGNKRIVSLIPGARGEEIPSVRHFPNVESPDAFNRILMGWLETRKNG